MDTIVALSSGSPPAAIAVVRVSGPSAFASVRTLRDADGEVLDRALVLCFVAPASVTGEELVEVHCHGGRAVVAAVTRALVAQPGVREAVAGEFTRRALGNGRIDLAQAEGLADLLEAETEAQRRVAIAATEGRVSDALRGWLDTLLTLSALAEAAIDFAEEEDVASETATLATLAAAMTTLREQILAQLAAPPIERIRDGIRVVLGGPPNSGKSTLLNLLADREAAIVSPIAGTTRDRVEAPVRRGGVAYLLVDTAGLTDTRDPIEQVGVERAQAAIADADLLLWLGDEKPARLDALWIQARGDVDGRDCLLPGRQLMTRSDQAATIDALWEAIAEASAALLPGRHAIPLRAQQRRQLEGVVDLLQHTDIEIVLIAEHLRRATALIASLLGINATEAMLDALFSRFCLGK